MDILDFSVSVVAIMQKDLYLYSPHLMSCGSGYLCIKICASEGEVLDSSLGMQIMYAPQNTKEFPTTGSPDVRYRWTMFETL